jgi:hypothetical protein
MNDKNTGNKGFSSGLGFKENREVKGYTPRASIRRLCADSLPNGSKVSKKTLEKLDAVMAEEMGKLVRLAWSRKRTTNTLMAEDVDSALEVWHYKEVLDMLEEPVKKLMVDLNELKERIAAMRYENG